MDSYSYVGNADVNYVDDMYNKYIEDPSLVDESWQNFFKGFDFATAQFGDSSDSTASSNYNEKELAVYQLIHAYRSRGHMRATTNPIRARRDRGAHLDLADFGLGDKDLETTFQVGKEIGVGPAKLKDILAALQKMYMGHIGFEYMYIRHRDRLEWFKEKFEKDSLAFKPTKDEIERILSKLNEAVVFENFLHTKYMGQKRFSLEGGESTIPALDELIQRGSELGVEEFVIGMAHRGRLNVLANIMGKTYEQIFNEFEGAAPSTDLGDGDVKYHMGFSSHVDTRSGKKAYLKLAPNPSHLEAVNPVVEGFVRGKADRLYNSDYSKIVPVLIHGDAAVAGQGIVYEVAQMHKLPGYKTGGTIHFVINNQVGFTTDYDDARSSIYCTDVAKTIDAPVLHVNGDNAEAVVFAMKLAIEYRQKFNRDIFIDMVCYRRHGHNESDEPKFTQPALYNIIAKHPNPREVYNEMLINRGDIGAEAAKNMDKAFRKLLQDRLNMVKQQQLEYKFQPTEIEWDQTRKSTAEDFNSSPDTSITQEQVDAIGKALTSLPEGFKALKQIDKLLKNRKEMFFDKKELDWACAELMAYGTLLQEDNFVRLSGQDVQRGTFSHRHAVVKDANTNEAHNFLNSLGAPREFEVYNSLLSEYGVLGFEFGYAMSHPHTLTIWEAQFGDFANGAQTMIDQFITTCETKWNIQSDLVLLLPHGQEGQGPEHSSARLERFLQACARFNMVVTNITTPANFFHAMRRQMKWEFRKPLVNMAPKSLLRHPLVVSKMEEFTDGKFQEIIGDEYVTKSKVKRVLLCTGKVYYDLLEEQQKSKRKDVAIVRIEQLYPLAWDQFNAEMAKYKGAEVFWVQEEPGNAGAWMYILKTLYKEIPGLECLAKLDSPSPAVGYLNVHKEKQAELVAKAFDVK